MPRAPRLDAPGAMHHVMIRGLERRVIFRDAPDRRDFLNRLGTACERTGARVLAWALLPTTRTCFCAPARTGFPPSCGRC